MEYKIGEFVRFVDEDIEGYITSIKNNNLIGVTDDSGFEIPVPINKVTKVQDETTKKGNTTSPVEAKKRVKEETQRQTSQDILLKTPAEFIEKGVFVGVIPQQIPGKADLYVSNNTSFEILISVSAIQHQNAVGISREIIKKNSSSKFFSGELNSIKLWPKFNFQILRFTSEEREITKPIDKTIKINSTDLSIEPEPLPILKTNGWLFPLDQQEKRKIEKLKEKHISHRPGSKNKNSIKIKGKIDLSRFNR
ncbi:MAG TPA: hypothetical protein VK102_00485 [Sphingobacterium sp.]|nr:hypothetical protein [Sphingobacterium sp.]